MRSLMPFYAQKAQQLGADFLLLFEPADRQLVEVCVLFE
jgi:hypothetical protein